MTDAVASPLLNLRDLFLGDRIREGRGHRIAVRVGDRTLTYEQIDLLAHRYARALAGLGIEPEQRVVIALPDGEDFVGALFGILQLGAVAVMVNPELPEPSLHKLLAYVRPRGAVVDPSLSEPYSRAGDGLPSSLRTLAPARDLASLAPPASLTYPIYPSHPDDVAIWLFSGGTTGRPKAVMQSHRSFANTTALYARATMGYHEDDVTLSVPKLFFGYATGSNLFFPFSVGASTVLFPEKPTPERLFELIRRHRPTVLVNVPTMVQRLLRHPDAGAQDLSCLRFSSSAGEALPAPLYQEWMETFGVELLDGLGTAEMWHIFLTNRPGEVRPGTLGRAVDGFEVKICDDEGRELPRGEPGQLWVRGRSRALGYWQESSKSEAAFRGEWYASSDLATMDEEGFVTFCGRDDDVIKVAGRWLAPKELEDCLLRHPAVRECAVIGVVDAGGLTKPWAFVVAEEPAAGLEEELRRHCLERLERYKHPRRVVLRDDLPRTHLGKIDRGRLRREVSELDDQRR